MRILSYELLTLYLGVPPHTNKPKKGNKDHIFLVFQTKILIKQLLVFYKIHVCVTSSCGTKILTKGT